MKTFEKVSVWIRHLPLLEHAEWVWGPVRPIYHRAVSHFGQNGLQRIINGSDRILVSPQVRGVSEKYEAEVWQAIMTELRAGDTFVDVGAFIGLYTIAVGLRLRGSGQVVAFEPDTRNFSLLREHVKLNKLESAVELYHAAVCDKDGESYFLANGSSESHLVSSGHKDTAMVDVVTLDSVFRNRRIDVLKIDVEGYERTVLSGAHNVLRTPGLRPRAVFVEVHPYAWQSGRIEGTALLRLLKEAGYRIETLDGIPVTSIQHYGEIVARSSE
jgi:FkbM family methyltransferase